MSRHISKRSQNLLFLLIQFALVFQHGYFMCISLYTLLQLLVLNFGISNASDKFLFDSNIHYAVNKIASGFCDYNLNKTRSFQQIKNLFTQHFLDRCSPSKFTIGKNVQKHQEGTSVHAKRVWFGRVTLKTGQNIKKF